MAQDDGQRSRPEVQQALKVVEDEIRRQDQRRERDKKRQPAKAYLKVVKTKAGLMWLVMQLGGF